MSARLDGRNGAIWAAYVRGQTQEALAERFKISQQRVSEIIREVGKQAADSRDRDALIAKELEHLERIRQMAQELADADLPPAFSDGRRMTDIGPGGEETVVRDASGRLAALDRVAKFGEHYRKVLALDAPAKVDLTVHGESEAASALAAQAAARLAGESEVLECTCPDDGVDPNCPAHWVVGRIDPNGAPGEPVPWPGCTCQWLTDASGTRLADDIDPACPVHGPKEG